LKYKSRFAAKGEKVVKFNEKLSKLNKSIFLKEFGGILVVSFAIYLAIRIQGHSENVAVFVLLTILCIGFFQRWNAHTSEHALSGKCIHHRTGYPEGTDLKEWEKRWAKDPDGGWNCSQTPLAGQSYCLVHTASMWRISTQGNRGGQSMSLEEQRKQFLKEHSEVAKTLFGDRTDLTDDEWYDLAMAAGNPRHPADK